MGTDAVISEESLVYGSDTLEERLLTRCDVRAAFRRLAFVERVVVALMQRYAVPPGYTGPWPPTPEQIGAYLGATFPQFGGQGVSTQAVVRLNQTALRQLGKWLGRGGVYDAS